MTLLFLCSTSRAIFFRFIVWLLATGVVAISTLPA